MHCFVWAVPPSWAPLPRDPTSPCFLRNGTSASFLPLLSACSREPVSSMQVLSATVPILAPQLSLLLAFQIPPLFLKPRATFLHKVHELVCLKLHLIHHLHSSTWSCPQLLCHQDPLLLRFSENWAFTPWHPPPLGHVHPYPLALVISPPRPACCLVSAVRPWSHLGN